MDPQFQTLGLGTAIGAALLALAQRWLPLILDRLKPAPAPLPGPAPSPHPAPAPGPVIPSPAAQLLEQLLVQALALGIQYLERMLQQPPAPPAPPPVK